MWVAKRCQNDDMSAVCVATAPPHTTSSRRHWAPTKLAGLVRSVHHWASTRRSCCFVFYHANSFNFSHKVSPVEGEICQPPTHDSSMHHASVVDALKKTWLTWKGKRCIYNTSWPLQPHQTLLPLLYIGEDKERRRKKKENMVIPLLLAMLWLLCMLHPMFYMGCGCVAEERAALMRISSSLHEARRSGNVPMEPWTGDCCSWSYVSCDDSARVSGLHLSKDFTAEHRCWDLNMTLFSPLHHLQRLDLSWNSACLHNLDRMHAT